MVRFRMFLIFYFRNGLVLQRYIFFRYFDFQKRILISKWTSHHNGMYFFDILISKNYPTLGYFVHFDLEIYFALQRHADILISKNDPRMVYFVNLKKYFT